MAQPLARVRLPSVMPLSITCPIATCLWQWELIPGHTFWQQCAAEAARTVRGRESWEHLNAAWPKPSLRRWPREDRFAPTTSMTINVIIRAGALMHRWRKRPCTNFSFTGVFLFPGEWGIAGI